MNGDSGAVLEDVFVFGNAQVRAGLAKRQKKEPRNFPDLRVAVVDAGQYYLVEGLLLFLGWVDFGSALGFRNESVQEGIWVEVTCACG